MNGENEPKYCDTCRYTKLTDALLKAILEKNANRGDIATGEIQKEMNETNEEIAVEKAYKNLEEFFASKDYCGKCG